MWYGLKKGKSDSTSRYKKLIKVDWPEYVKTKNLAKRDHEEDRPTDDSKAGNRLPQKFRKTGSRIEILVPIRKTRKRRKI